MTDTNERRNPDRKAGKDTESDRQTDRQTNRHTDIQTDRQRKHETVNIELIKNAMFRLMPGLLAEQGF